MTIWEEIDVVAERLSSQVDVGDPWDEEDVLLLLRLIKRARGGWRKSVGMIKFRALFGCDHCKRAEEFWIDRYSQIPAMASRATRGEFAGVRPKDFPTAVEMCGEKVMTLILCKDCCAKFKGKFSYAPGAR